MSRTLYVLTMLLMRLQTRGTSCPYCEGEKAHVEKDCVLRDIWFQEEMMESIKEMMKYPSP
jgi:hypothetical protein